MSSVPSRGTKMSTIPYLVMAGIRGPDRDSGSGAAVWKAITVAPFRDLVRRALDAPPSWCQQGDIAPPKTRRSDFHSIRKTFAEQARGETGDHVVDHLRWAYLELGRWCTSMGRTDLAHEVYEHYDWLKMNGWI